MATHIYLPIPEVISTSEKTSRKKYLMNPNFPPETIAYATVFVFTHEQGTTVQKLDVPGPDEKFCLCWL